MSCCLFDNRMSYLPGITIAAQATRVQLRTDEALIRQREEHSYLEMNKPQINADERRCSYIRVYRRSSAVSIILDMRQRMNAHAVSVLICVHLWFQSLSALCIDLSL